MNNKMTLVVVKETQHVVGAITLTAQSNFVLGSSGVRLRFQNKVVQPQPPPAVAPTVTGRQSFRVSADHLETVTLDLKPSVLVAPLDYVVKGKTKLEIPAASIATPAFKSNEVKVVVPAPAAPNGLKVWVQITGVKLTSPMAINGLITQGMSDCTIAYSENLKPGDYIATTLVEGHKMQFDVLSISQP